MDGHGYPEKDDIAWLKEELSVMDFHRGANAIKSLIESTGYGRATIGINPGRLEVATDGWSGCEEILSETHDTLWRMAFWESTHRGGLEVFINTRTAGGVEQLLELAGKPKGRKRMEIDINKKMLCECARSLFTCCQSVGGAPPNLNMTLQEFIDSYGWNGVKFSLSEIRKQ